MSFENVALIVVDVQNDFCEGGALAVEGGNDVAERIAWNIKHCRAAYREIVFTKDWHNPLPDTNGGHFDEWPVHCVEGTYGSRFHEAIWNVRDPYTMPIFRKGQGRPDYSGFQGINSGETLNEFLREHGIDEVHIVGIAGDYCVKATALDAKRLGFLTYILPSMVASVGGQAATEAAQLELATA